MTIPTVNEILARTAIGGGWQNFPVEGGSVRLPAAELRRALEAAYDETMPDWVATIDLEA